MRSHSEQASPTLPRLPHPRTQGYADLPQFLTKAPLPFRRIIRRHEVHQIVPLADTTIHELEQLGEFPRRFRLTARCVVWDLDEVEAWIEARKRASRTNGEDKASGPDVRQRTSRPVRAASVAR